MKMTAERRAIDKVFRRRDRYDIPDWQRSKVWSREKKQKLIDSILRGWKLPKFYFLKLSEEEIEVVDGQQRLSAILDFFSNELPLSRKAAAEFGGEYYRDLPQRFADAFDDFEIEYDLIEEADEKELKEFFQRLQEGLPLTSSEKLNSVHSKLRDFCKRTSEHPFFKVRVLASNRRYGHFDIVAKVAALEIEGLDASLRYEDLKEVFESNASFAASSAVGRRIRAALDYLDRAFPGERNPLFRNRTIVQSLLTLTCKMLEAGKAAGTESRLKQFLEDFMLQLSHQVELGHAATDADYVLFQKTVSANVRTGAATRQQVLLRKLLAFDPAFADLFGPAVVAQSGVNRRISQVAESIAKLTSEINSAYAAKNGEDLIKPTNRTTQSLLQLGKPIPDGSGYEVLIDELYFLFWEGPGERIGTVKPQSFVDINILRTDIRHDVDHGDQSKIRAKRKKAGEAFRKYAGVSTPRALATERFPLLQANLLSAVETDLRHLLEQYSS